MLTPIKGFWYLVTKHLDKIQTILDHYQYQYQVSLLTWNYREVKCGSMSLTETWKELRLPTLWLYCMDIDLCEQTEAWERMTKNREWTCYRGNGVVCELTTNHSNTLIGISGVLNFYSSPPSQLSFSLWLAHPEKARLWPVVYQSQKA